ncbi:hypothetical protein [Floridanema aerugineum]|uniref:Uncharacterized protein n=1 Tax=Floridaenema aerugineum BLCC-F46 TaxID=3153654 RepID=A0ABV4WXL5_9CYAN
MFTRIGSSEEVFAAESLEMILCGNQLEDQAIGTLAHIVESKV